MVKGSFNAEIIIRTVCKIHHIHIHMQLTGPFRKYYTFLAALTSAHFGD